jgi:transcriptional regulator with XRE-family HTH domain
MENVPTKKSVHAEVARNIRRLRRQKGWSQEKLAFEADVHRVFVGRIERCEQSPSLSTLEKIAKALNTPIQDLF